MPIQRFDISLLQTAFEQKATILVPNHRIRDAIVDSYATASLTGTWTTPKVFAIDIWLQQLWRSAASHGISPFADYQILEGIEELFIWSAIIEKSLVDIPLLNPDETATVVSQSYQDMRQWLVDEADQQKLVINTGIPDVEVFLKWKQQYLSYCKDNRLISLVDCTHEILAQLNQGTIHLPKQIYLVNFYQPPPLYQRLFECLQLQTDVQSILCRASDVKRTTTGFQFADKDSEIHACANWVKTTVHQQPDCHIGIIYNRVGVERSSLERQFADILYPDSLLNLAEDTHVFNRTSADQSLADNALVHDAFRLLELNHKQQHSDTICRLLQSPYIAGYNNEIEARIRFELFMRDNLTATCTLSEIIRLMTREEKPHHCPELAAVLMQAKTQFREMAELNTAAIWAAMFQQQLAILGWPGSSQSLTAKENKALGQWQQAISRFSRAGIALGKLNFATALARLKMLCSHTRKKIRFNRDSQLSLYSASEAVGLKFSHVWFLGFDDQSWPPSANPSPFLPYSLQKELAIPGSHAEVQYQLALETFESICACVCGNIIGSHYQLEGDQQLRPSSFISSFNQVASPVFEPHPLNKYAASTAGDNSLVQIDDCNGFGLIEDENPRGGQSIISNQSSCPFRAFAKHRLHADPMRKFETGLTSMARGTAIHIALEYLFSDLDSLAKLNALLNENQRSLINQAVNVAINYLRKKFSEVMTPRFQAIEQQRIESLLFRFLDLEKQRADFSVIAREQTQQWQRGQLSLRLKIDRIDKLADGSLALIDYKTGKYTKPQSNLLDIRPEDMQLPVYYSVMSDQYKPPVSAVVIGHVNAAKIDYFGISASDNFHNSVTACSNDQKLNTSWDELTSSWQQKVDQFADEFISGVASVSPVKGISTCQYCGLEPLCRIREIELGLNLADETGDEQ